MEEEGSGIQTVLVFVAKEVDVREVGRWEEGFERDGRVDKNEVCIDPPKCKD